MGVGDKVIVVSDPTPYRGMDLLLGWTHIAERL